MSAQRAQNFSRIASLDPAATEMLFALGAGDRVVAISHDSDYPETARARTIVSFSKLGDLEDSKQIDDRVKEFVNRGESLYQVNNEILSKLDVDLVVTQDLCGLCAVSSADVEDAISRMKSRPEVYSMHPPRTLEDILELARKIGSLVNADAEAKHLISVMEKRIERVRRLAADAITTPNVACVEWLEPLEVSPSWVSEMLEYCHSVLRPTRSEITNCPDAWSYLIESNPDVLVVSPCSFKIEQTRKEMNKLLSKVDWRRISAVQNKRAYFVDSDYFNRAGLRLVDGLEVTATLVHPHIFGELYEFPRNAVEKISQS
jgi:iron complex transport system substrate-binding protein